MARIPPEEIERIKREVSLQRLVEARGIELKPVGKDLVGLCPFHPEKTPSLHITPANNLWHCFGCNEGGDNIRWVMKTEGVTFRHAFEILREGRAMTGATPIKAYKSFRCRGKLPSPVAFDAEGRELLKQVVNFYHETLKQGPEALAYLEKRGLTNSEMIDHFKIGYSNRTLGLRLPESNRHAGAAIRGKLVKLGIYRESGHENFSGSIIIPVFDEHGDVSEIYARKIRDDLREGTTYHLYLQGPHKGVFNFQALQASKDIILCEALIDALTFWCAGFRNVTASYGANGFTPDHLEAFKKYGVERVYIAYDRDQTGNTEAQKLAEELIAEGFECFRILFPRDMDANEYALKVGPPEKSLDLVFRNAVWIGKGKRKVIQVPIIPEEEKEPKAATKGEKIPEEIPSREIDSQLSEEAPSEEPQSVETLSQVLKEENDIFPLAAKETPEPSPTPEPVPPRPEDPKIQNPQPAQAAPVSRPLAVEPVIEIREE